METVASTTTGTKSNGLIPHAHRRGRVPCDSQRPNKDQTSTLILCKPFLSDVAGAVADFPESDLRREAVQACRVPCVCERFPAQLP